MSTLAGAEAWARHAVTTDYVSATATADHLPVLLAEYDRRGAALAYAEELGGQVVRAEAQAVRDLEEELVGVRSQLDAVRALAEDAMKLPTLDYPRAADDSVSPRAILAALGEWPRSQPPVSSPVLPSGGTAT